MVNLTYCWMIICIYVKTLRNIRRLREGNKIKIFYHNDLDGHCSGAIAYKYYTETTVNSSDIELIESKYGMGFDSVEKDELVVIVDFSFQLPGQFEELTKLTKNIVWIDHHRTAIEEFEHFGFDGIRRDGTAGCELAWEYYFSALPVPDVVKYIGDMDVWKWEYPKTEAIVEGLGLYNTHPSSVGFWQGLFDSSYSMTNIYNSGIICLAYRDNYYAKLAKHISYEVYWKGYKCIACNCAFTGSPVFKSIDGENKYDITITYYHNGKGYTFSLYSNKEGVKCCDIAKEYGGGGHNGAAGFRCDTVPFRRSAC